MNPPYSLQFDWVEIAAFTVISVGIAFQLILAVAAIAFLSIDGFLYWKKSRANKAETM